MAALVDTNVLVYRFDSRFAAKKKIATELLRRGVILTQADSLREAEEFLKHSLFSIQMKRSYATPCVAARPIRCWSYAEHYGLPEIWTEDMQHDRLYGSVRVVNPFLGLS